MNETDQIIRFCRSPLQNKLQKLAQPLIDCFGLDVLMFTKIGHDGSLFQISNFPELSEYYWNTDFFLTNPFFHHPNCYRSGTLLITDCTSEEFHTKQSELYRLYNSKCVLVSFIKEAEDVYWIGFSAKDKELPLSSLSLNEVLILKRYASYLVDEWKSYLNKMGPYTINIAKELGWVKFREGFPYSKKTTVARREEFLKKIGLIDSETAISSLSKREYECLCFMLKGHSASQIANNLCLSSRTIEHYMISIKNKYGCTSKAELLEKALALREFGLL